MGLPYLGGCLTLKLWLMMGLWWWWVLASRRLSAMVFNEVSLRFRVVFMEEKREGGAHAMHKLSLFFVFFPTTFHCFLLVESDWYVFRIKSPKNISFFFLGQAGCTSWSQTDSLLLGSNFNFELSMCKLQHLWAWILS